MQLEVCPPNFSTIKHLIQVRVNLRLESSILLWFTEANGFSRGPPCSLLCMCQLLQGDDQILKNLALVILIVTGFFCVALLTAVGTMDCMFALPGSAHLPKRIVLSPSTTIGGRTLDLKNVRGLNDQHLVLGYSPA